jgi:hypothetical protein
MSRSSEFSVGDRVRIRATPDTVRAEVAGTVGVVVLVTPPGHQSNEGAIVYEVEFDPENVPLVLGSDLLELV